MGITPRRADHRVTYQLTLSQAIANFIQVIARIKQIIERKVPRPNDLLILSDHGQSFGHTFLQRHVPQGTTVGQTSGGDDGTLQLASMAGELQRLQDQSVGGATGKAIVKRAGQYADRAVNTQLAEGELAPPVSITVCGSGNLGQIYFNLYLRRIKQNELDAAYPGLIEALVRHEGIGVLVVADEAGVPIVLGKNG
jgi:hypothetical protein